MKQENESGARKIFQSSPKWTDGKLGWKWK